jgi:hypothetical protein
MTRSSPKKKLMDKKKTSPQEIPPPAKYPEQEPPFDPDMPVFPEEDPLVIPDEDPFEMPPFEVPPPGESP